MVPWTLLTVGEDIFPGTAHLLCNNVHSMLARGVSGLAQSGRIPSSSGMTFFNVQGHGACKCAYVCVSVHVCERPCM